jgi:hypothetical protein
MGVLCLVTWCAVFVGFSRIFLLRILIFKGLTARRLYKSFGVKGLNGSCDKTVHEVYHPVSLLLSTDMLEQMNVQNCTFHVDIRFINMQYMR